MNQVFTQQSKKRKRLTNQVFNVCQLLIYVADVVSPSIKYLWCRHWKTHITSNDIIAGNGRVKCFFIDILRY